MAPPTTAMSPEHASFARESALRHLGAGHPVTRRAIDAIPLDQGDDRPDAIAKTDVDLAWHIAGAEHRFMGAA